MERLQEGVNVATHSYNGLPSYWLSVLRETSIFIVNMVDIVGTTGAVVIHATLLEG